MLITGYTDGGDDSLLIVITVVAVTASLVLWMWLIKEHRDRIESERAAEQCKIHLLTAERLAERERAKTLAAEEIAKQERSKAAAADQIAIQERLRADAAANVAELERCKASAVEAARIETERQLDQLLAIGANLISDCEYHKTLHEAYEGHARDLRGRVLTLSRDLARARSKEEQAKLVEVFLRVAGMARA